ncbi:MAG: transposase family protein [Rhizobacter sp.]|nr:transposase family protein [Rhizobacter sp.]
MAHQETPIVQTRRRFEPALKQELVRRSLEPGASVSGIALGHGINANVLFKWRRQYLFKLAAAARQQVGAQGAQAVLLPVHISTATSIDQGKTARASQPPRLVDGVIEIDVGASRVRVQGCVEEAMLVCALRTLRSFA